MTTEKRTFQGDQRGFLPDVFDLQHDAAELQLLQSGTTEDTVHHYRLFTLNLCLTCK